MRSVHPLCLLLSMVTIGAPYPNFQEKIPNGAQVKHPCGQQYAWAGVGHENPRGGGARNPFGVAFKAAGLKWTEEFCQSDSDGDGLSNGQELGDPNCNWGPGDVPAGPSTSHPGVCDPVDSPECAEKNAWLSCDDIKDQQCSAITEPDTQNITLRFNVTEIPDAVTNYFCQVFELPHAGDYHMVATSPIINNPDIVHHMLLFACDERENPMEASKKPFRCGMYPDPRCRQIIGTWTVGGSGDCLFPESGFRMGVFGFRKAALQIHWNNPRRLTGQRDSSGMTLYFTNRTRMYDASTLIVGQQYLHIPPFEERTTFTARCLSGCTRGMIRDRIFISRAVNHMHFLGTAQTISIHRNGSKFMELTNDQNYDYNSPVYYHYHHPIEVLPGDEIRTTCVYKPSPRNISVFFGDGTDDEMCYGFLTYYPAQSLNPPYCFSYKSVDECQKRAPYYKGLVQGCAWKKYTNESFGILHSLHQRLDDSCKSTMSSRVCSPACHAVVKEARAADRCLTGDIGEYLLGRTEKGTHVMQLFLMCRDSSVSDSTRCVSSIFDVMSVFVVVYILLLRRQVVLL